MKQEEEKQRVRRAYNKGGSAQKMMSFRLDNELAEFLEQQGNKGRYINELIRADMKKNQE